MIWGQTAAMMMTTLIPVLGYAANPFLNTPNDMPVSAKFRGTEWSDDIGEQDIALTARVVTTRLARMSWGAIFKVEFTDLKSRADKPREILPDYFIVTNDRIVLLNEKNNDEAAMKISALETAGVRNERHLQHHQRQLRTPGGGVENDNQIERRPLHL